MGARGRDKSRCSSKNRSCFETKSELERGGGRRRGKMQKVSQSIRERGRERKEIEKRTIVSCLISREETAQLIPAQSNVSPLLLASRQK